MRTVGRPPRVTTAEIAEAALAIGLDSATVRTVADRLGMSVPGMYHHVRSRDDLLAVAANHVLGTVPVPDDVGQPWTEWLVEYARFVHERMVAHPEVLGQVRAGGVDVERQRRHTEALVAVLVDRGFTADEALEAYVLLMVAAAGSATSEVGRRATRAAGRSMLAGVERIDPFDTVRLVVDALAARRGGATP